MGADEQLPTGWGVLRPGLHDKEKERLKGKSASRVQLEAAKARRDRLKAAAPPQACKACSGTGKVDGATCRKCLGVGRVRPFGKSRPTASPVGTAAPGGPSGSGSGTAGSMSGAGAV